MRTPIVALLLCALTAPDPANADVWPADPANSSITFSVRHLMINDVRGTFATFTASVEMPEGTEAPRGVEVSIETASLDTGHGGRDEHLRGEDFLDAGRHPSIAFVARDVNVKDGGVTATGPLELHGVTRDVTIPLEITPVIRDPWGNERRGLRATFTLDRRDWDITWSESLDGGGLVVGNDVTVTASFELVRRASR